eukprot:5129446-Heterocapsa_arctica.AAC.1
MPIVDGLEGGESGRRTNTEPVLHELNMPYEPWHQARRCSQASTESLLDVDHVRAQQAHDGLRVARNATHAAARS